MFAVCLCVCPARNKLWTSISVWSVPVLFTVLTLVMFAALYATQLSKNFLMFDDYYIGWRSEGRTDLDFSFYFIVGGAAAFLLNLILLSLSGQSLRCSYAGSGEKEIDNGMILYWVVLTEQFGSGRIMILQAMAAFIWGIWIFCLEWGFLFLCLFV